MSSSYHLLCLGHDPATEVMEIRDIMSFPKLEDLVSTHPKCDMVVTRLSGGLVEIGCPGFPTGPCRGHDGINWVDADWLRLLFFFEPDDPRSEFQSLIGRHTFKCWPYRRLHILRYELEI